MRGMIILLVSMATATGFVLDGNGTSASTSSRKCQVCNPNLEFLCESITDEKDCPADQNYCINHVVNHADGSKNVNRRCGTLADCRNGWYLQYSDDPRCTSLNPNHINTHTFTCEYCCTTDNCNMHLNPPDKYAPSA